MHFLIKVLTSALVIATVSEVAKRSSTFAAIIASLPLTSILAMTWLYLDTRDAARVAELSTGIFWAVLPSLLFFIVLPLLLKAGWKFPSALTVSCALMAGGYALYVYVLRKLGAEL